MEGQHQAWLEQLSDVLGRSVTFGAHDPVLDRDDIFTALAVEAFVRQFNRDFALQADDQLTSLTIYDLAYYCGLDT